jgi:hypothetical protein
VVQSPFKAYGGCRLLFWNDQPSPKILRDGVRIQLF